MRRDVFQAIADPVRRDIIGLLAEQRMTVNAVAKQFEISRPAISKHIKILHECGMVAIHQQGSYPQSPELNDPPHPACALDDKTPVWSYSHEKRRAHRGRQPAPTFAIP